MSERDGAEDTMTHEDMTPAEQVLVERDRERHPVDWATVPKEVTRLLDHYYPKGRPNLTRSQVATIVARLKYPSQMARETLPMVCLGEGTDSIPQCPYVPGCPLVDAKVPPLGQRCPFESANIAMWFGEYMKEMQVRSDDFVETNQVKEIILMDLIMQRAGAQLANDGMVDENPIGVIPGGKDAASSVIYRRDPAALMSVISDAQQRKLKVLQSMLATREAKAKHETLERGDLATMIQKLMKKRERMPDEFEDGKVGTGG